MSDDLRSGDAAYYESLGRAIKVLRTARGIDRKELAALADISYPYLSQIEAGAKRASSDVIRAIADALGLRPHELLETADSVMTSSPSVPARRARATSAPVRSGGAAEDADGVRDVPAPMMFAMAAAPPAPSSEPRRGAARWFHAESPPPPAPPPPPGTSRSRRELLGELVALTETLGDDDLERLVDLAHRLAAS